MIFGDLSENIIMEMSEEQQSIAEQLSELILEEYKCISVKMNYSKDEPYDPSNIRPPEDYPSVAAYFRHYDLEVVFSTMGVHLNGEHKRPHAHYHLIVKKFPSKTFSSQSSTHRNRWLDISGNEIYSFKDTTFSFPKKQDPVWCHLAYPFKEGIPLKRGVKGLNQAQYDFLKEYGKTQYEVSLAQNLRNDACRERKKAAREKLMSVCEDGHKGGDFDDYRSMVKWLDIFYIKTLDFSEYPDPKNYKVWCQQCAVKLGILNYSDIV